MSQSIREWNKENLWKAAFKKFEAVRLLQADHTPSNFLKAVFHNFTWPILEYFVPDTDTYKHSS